MVDTLITFQPLAGPFDTALLQLTQARAQALAANANEVAFLQALADNNEQTNARLLSSPDTSAPTDALLGTPPDAETPGDHETLTLFSVFGKDISNPANSDEVKAQQLHDLGILQRDVALLELAAHTENHIPLGTDASTVDLSPEAQTIVQSTSGVSASADEMLTPQQLSNISEILQPFAHQPLTPTLLQSIQAQLAAQHHHIHLSLNMLAQVMGHIGGMQSSPYHLPDTSPTWDEQGGAVAPVAALGNMGLLGGSIRQ